jgi:hypothetical protein
MAGLVAAAFDHDGPGGPRGLVGDRDHRLLGRHAPEQLHHPGVLVRPDLRLLHDGHGAGDEKRAQIAIALLGKPVLFDLAAARIVLGYEADPRRQMPAVLEQHSVGDPGPERAGDHRPDRGDRLEAGTWLARLVLLTQRRVERGNFGTDRLDLSNKDHQGCACRRGQPLIALVTDDRRQLGQSEQTSCRDDAELAQVPAHTVHELRALADQLQARAVH